MPPARIPSPALSLGPSEEEGPDPLPQVVRRVAGRSAGGSIGAARPFEVPDGEVPTGADAPRAGPGLSAESDRTAEAWLALLLGQPESRAARLLAKRPLRDLGDLSVRELIEDLGLDRVAAERLVAALALGRRAVRARRPERAPLHSAERVHALVWPELVHLEKERFLGLYLDGKHRLRDLVRISEGTLTASLVHPREVFRPAIRGAAAAVIVVHNHPSGDPEPSAEDVDVTRRLREAGRVVGIPLVDHVVCAERGFVSLRERLGF